MASTDPRVPSTRAAALDVWRRVLEAADPAPLVRRALRLEAGRLVAGRFTLDLSEVAGVIGMSVLRRFDVSFDYRKRTFELAPKGSGAKESGVRVPFELWGEDELTVWGSINGGRRLALTLATGLPGGGLGAPDVVFEEHGLKSSGVAKLVKGAGVWLQGRAWSQVSVPAISLGNVAFDRLSGWSGAMHPLPSRRSRR